MHPHTRAQTLQQEERERKENVQEWTDEMLLEEADNRFELFECFWNGRLIPLTKIKTLSKFKVRACPALRSPSWRPRAMLGCSVYTRVVRFVRVRVSACACACVCTVH